MTEHEGVQVKSQLPGIAQALKAVKDRVRKENRVVAPIVSAPVEDVSPTVVVVSDVVVEAATSEVVKKKGARKKAVKARVVKAAGASAVPVTKRKARVVKAAGASAVPVTKRKARVSVTPDAGIKVRVGSGTARVLSKLVLKDFNAKEVLVLRQLQTQAQPLTIQILSELCFRDLDSKRTSWARNSLRRLVRDGAVEQVGRGLYAITEGGKRLVCG
jgi:hypothetical protein